MLLIERIEEYFDDYERLVSGFYFSETNVNYSEYHLDFITQDAKNKLAEYCPTYSSSKYFNIEPSIGIFHASRYEFRFNNKIVPYFADRKIDFDCHINRELVNMLCKFIKSYLAGDNISGDHEYKIGRRTGIIKIVIVK